MNKLIKSLPTSRRLRGLGLGAAVLLGAVALAGIADARPGHGKRGHGGPGMFGRTFFKMVQHLDLSEEQEVAAVRLRRSMREEMKSIREGMRTDMSAIADEMKKTTPDRQRIHQLLDAVNARKQQMAHTMADKALDFHANLTPDQKAEVAKIIEERQARHAERREARQARREARSTR